MISCFAFYVVEFPNESKAKESFQVFSDHYSGPSMTEGQTVTVIESPLVGDERVASTLLSTVWQIGSCGTRDVYAYAAVIFRRGSVLVEVVGFSPRAVPSPDLSFQMAEVLQKRVDGLIPR